MSSQAGPSETRSQERQRSQSPGVNLTPLQRDALLEAIGEARGRKDIDLDDWKLSQPIIDATIDILTARLDRFGFREPPSERTIRSNWAKHVKCIPLTQKSKAGRKQRDMPDLPHLLQQSDSGERMSIRDMANKLGVSHSTVLLRMKKFKVRFYRRRRVEILKEQHVRYRLEFAEIMHEKIQSKIIDINNILFTDESMILIGPQDE